MKSQLHEDPRTRSAAPNVRQQRSTGVMRRTLLAADPLYKQVRSDVVDRIASGEWKPGEIIPSERRLADDYGVGIATIRAAISELTTMKVLARRQGKGTFVCREDERRGVYQFFHIVRDDGVKALPASELLWIRNGRADFQTAHALNLPRSPAGLEIYKLRNVLSVGDVPVVVSDIAIPAAMFRGLTEEWIRTGGSTLYAVYQSRFGINIVRTDEQLRAVPCDGATAKILRVGKDEPVLEVRRTAYTFNDVPVEVRRSRVQTRNYHYALSCGGAR